MPKPLKILQASAGSGKTFSLTAHYLTLLFSGAHKYREILAVTFTNKATEEMKTRILEVLKGLATGDGKYNVYRDIILSAHQELNPGTLRDAADITYRRILHDYSRFSVNTIDGFVQKVIRGFAFELGLEAGYALEMNQDKVKNELADRLDQALDQHPALLQWIIDLAITRINNNSSWNYRNELLSLTAELFKERYQPFQNAVTALAAEKGLDALFKDYQQLTSQHLSDFEKAITGIAEEGAQLFEVMDIDPVVLKGKSRSPLLNLRKIAQGDYSRIKGLQKMIDEPSEWFPDQNNADLQQFYNELNPLLKELTGTYQRDYAGYITAENFNKSLYYLRLMQEMALILKSYREESSTLLLSDAQQLLKGITDDADGNPSFIWEKMGNRYKHFLFDEFQDTSTNQWSSFRSLVTNALAAPGGKLIDHLIVGDTKQSIYRWRNGDWNILHSQARNDVGAHNVVEDSLEENHRSTANIINFNNMLFKDLAGLMQDQLNNNVLAYDTDGGVEQWWTAKGFNHIVTDVYSNATQKHTARTLPGGTIKYNVLRSEEEGSSLTKGSFAEESINRAIEEIKLLVTAKNYSPGDICILVRKNDEAVAMVEALLSHNINVISGEALKIANNNAVKLLLNTLQMLIGVPANSALYKANCISLYARLKGEVVHPAQLFGLDRKTLAQLGHLLPASLCGEWQRWMQQPLPELLEKLIHAYALDQHSEELPYLFALRDLAGDFARQGEQGIAAFLRFWEEEGAKKNLPSLENADAVQVLTIHKSKGLAFRAVMLPFCNWDINGKSNDIFWVPAAGTPYHALQSIPLKYNKSLGYATVAGAYFEELLFSNMDALNTLYVAATRAKEYLYINAAGKKTSTISNIGDLLTAALNNKLDDGAYIIDEPVQDGIRRAPSQNTLILDSYPVSDRLDKVFDAQLRTRDFERLTGENAGRKGAILHDVLAKAEGIDDIDQVLDELLTAGIFKAAERDELKRQARAVLKHEDLQNILRSGKQSLTERTIVATDGKSYRPDKVVISDDGVAIIDYKFTLEESDSHIAQITHYKALLLAMGYLNVSTYLFYALSGELKLV